MVLHMKTTMNIPDALYAALKRRAVTEGRTVTSIVEQAIRAFTSTPSAPAPADLPTWQGGSADGYLVDISDSRALWDVMDEV